MSDDFVNQLEKHPHLKLTDIDKCFPPKGEPAADQVKQGFRGPFNLLGSLRLGKGDVVTAQYTLHALGTDGTTVVGYGLEMTGSQTSGSDPFAPGEGQTTTVAWDGVAIFHAGGDAPACVGGGGMHSAQKEVNISSVDSVTVKGN